MYRKRLLSLLKKANELLILTGADVYVVTGRKSKCHEYTSTNKVGWPVSRQAIVSSPIILPHPFPLLTIDAHQMDSSRSVSLGPELFTNMQLKNVKENRVGRKPMITKGPIRSDTDDELEQPRIVRNLLDKLASVFAIPGLPPHQYTPS